MVSLCWLDIAHALMPLSRFCQCPRKGHIVGLKHVCGYIKKFPQGAICIHTGIPDHESVFGENLVKYDWMETVYGNQSEEIPADAQAPKGNTIHTSTYCYANLLHDLVMGRSATGLLHFLNQTPTDWFSK